MSRRISGSASSSTRSSIGCRPATCRGCEKISQPPAPFHPTPRGWAGPNLLATIVFEKYGQHQPLNRQRDRYAREGVDLSLSTLADQVGASTVALRPLHDLIAAHVMAAERLHGDDTPVPVPAKGKTNKGRAWVYVRDDRPFGGPDPPAALFRYSRNRSGDHPVEHLKSFDGILQADSFGGYNRLYAATRLPGPVTEVPCWAHSRRKFFELADIAASKGRKNAPPISPLALEAVKRIDVLFDIERGINGETAARRHAVRQELSAPLVAELETWMKTERARLSRHAPVATGRKIGGYRSACRMQRATAALDRREASSQAARSMARPARPSSCFRCSCCAWPVVDRLVMH